eukprot:jgi/Chlat1/8963/Chrsp94S08256
MAPTASLASHKEQETMGAARVGDEAAKAAQLTSRLKRSMTGDFAGSVVTGPFSTMYPLKNSSTPPLHHRSMPTSPTRLNSPPQLPSPPTVATRPATTAQQTRSTEAAVLPLMVASWIVCGDSLLVARQDSSCSTLAVGLACGLGVSSCIILWRLPAQVRERWVMVLLWLAAALARGWTGQFSSQASRLGLTYLTLANLSFVHIMHCLLPQMQALHSFTLGLLTLAYTIVQTVCPSSTCSIAQTSALKQLTCVCLCVVSCGYYNWQTCLRRKRKSLSEIDSDPLSPLWSDDGSVSGPQLKHEVDARVFGKALEELRTPFEELVEIVDRIVKEGKPPKMKHMLQMKQLLECDLFQPQFESFLSKSNIDSETQSWLMSEFLRFGNERLQPKKSTEARRSTCDLAHAVPPRRVARPSEVVGDIVDGRNTTRRMSPAIASLLVSAGLWDFEVFQLAALTNGKPLSTMGMMLMDRHGLISRMSLNEQKLLNFFHAVEQGMPKNPYHNATHLADVMSNMFHMLAFGGLREYTDDLHHLAALIAAAVHDYKHPGRSNDYLNKSGDKLALRYNDQSVLENHHLAESFQLMLQPDMDFMENLPKKAREQVRGLIIQMVLATDLKRHFEVVDKFKTRLRSSRPFEKGNLEDQTLLLSMALKCADIGHVAKPPSLHLRWVKAIEEEFYLQGDDERASGMEISPFMDRHSHNLPKAQVGFFNFIALPLLQVWATAFEQHQHIYEAAKRNSEYWTQELAKKTAAEIPPPSS